MMARKTVLICDGCGGEIKKATGARLHLTFVDARRAPKEADYCDSCVRRLPGTRLVPPATQQPRRGRPRRASRGAQVSQAKRGRRPKAATRVQVKPVKNAEKRKARARVGDAASVDVVSKPRPKSVNVFGVTIQLEPDDPETKRKKADQAARRRRQKLVAELNAEPSLNDAMHHRLPGSFESGKRR
jgi:hypothetical protein